MHFEGQNWNLMPSTTYRYVASPMKIRFALIDRNHNENSEKKNDDVNVCARNLVRPFSCSSICVNIVHPFLARTCSFLNNYSLGAVSSIKLLFIFAHVRCHTTFKCALASQPTRENYRYHVAEFINKVRIYFYFSRSKGEMHAMELLDGLENSSMCLCFVYA